MAASSTISVWVCRAREPGDRHSSCAVGGCRAQPLVTVPASVLASALRPNKTAVCRVQRDAFLNFTVIWPTLSIMDKPTTSGPSCSYLNRTLRSNAVSTTFFTGPRMDFDRKVRLLRAYALRTHNKPPLPLCETSLAVGHGADVDCRSRFETRPNMNPDPRASAFV
jgi:hypothetical protein